MADTHLNTVNQITKDLKEFNIQDFIDTKTEELYSFVDDLLGALGLSGLTLDSLLSLRDLDLEGILRTVLGYFGLEWLVDLYFDIKNLIDSFINMISGVLSVLGGTLIDRMGLLGLLGDKCGYGSSAWNNYNNSYTIRGLLLTTLFSLLACFGIDAPMTDIVNKIDPVEIVIISAERVDSEGNIIPEVTEEKRSHKFDSYLVKQINPMLSNPKNKRGIDTLYDYQSHGFLENAGSSNPDIYRNAFTALDNDTTHRDDPANDFDKVNESLEYLDKKKPDTFEYTKSKKYKDLALAKSRTRKPNFETPSAFTTDIDVRLI